MSKRPHPHKADNKKSGKNQVKREENAQQQSEAVSYEEVVKIQEGVDAGIKKPAQKLKRIVMSSPDREEGQIVSYSDEQRYIEDQNSEEDEVCDAPIEEGYLKREPSTANDEKQSKSASPSPQQTNNKIKEEDSKLENDEGDQSEEEEDQSENEEEGQCNEGTEGNSQDESQNYSQHSEDDEENGKSRENEDFNSQSDAKLEEPSEEYYYVRENQFEKIQSLQANVCLKLEHEEQMRQKQRQVKLESMDEEDTSFSKKNYFTPELTGTQLSYQFIVCPCGRLQAGPLHFILHIQQEHRQENLNEILMKRLMFYEGADFDELQKELIQQQRQQKQLEAKNALQSQEEKEKEEDFSSSDDDSLGSEVDEEYIVDELDQDYFVMSDIDYLLHNQLEDIANNYQEESLSKDVKKLARITAQQPNWSLFVQDFFQWASHGTLKMKFVLTDFFIYLLTFIKMQKMKFSPAKFLRNKNSFSLLYDTINYQMQLGINITPHDIERLVNVLARWFYEYGFIRKKPIERIDLEEESDLEYSYTSELDQREMIKRMEREGRLEMQEETRSEPSYDYRL